MFDCLFCLWLSVGDDRNLSVLRWYWMFMRMILFCVIDLLLGRLLVFVWLLLLWIYISIGSLVFCFVVRFGVCMLSSK